MTILRSLLAVIMGYLVFAVSSFLFFRIAGVQPHQSARLAVVLGAVAFGVVMAVAGGYLAARLATRRPLAHATAVAIVLALGALGSLVATLGHGAVWTQAAALVVMAPAAVVGGWLRGRQAGVG